MLRPDKGRSYEAVMWSVLEWPEWFRQRLDSAGWLGLCYVLSCQLDAANVTIGCLLKHCVGLAKLK